MYSADRKNRSEVFKNNIIAFSIIIGGLWALYKFDAKLEVDISTAKLEKSVLELTKRPVLIPSMSMLLQTDSTTNKRILKTSIEILNRGNSDASVSLSEESLRVAKVIMDKGVIVGYQRKIFTNDRSIPSINDLLPYIESSGLVILSGQKKTVVFLVEVEEPGLYQVEFKSLPSKEIVELREKAFKTGVTRQTFSVTDYIFIQNKP